MAVARRVAYARRMGATSGQPNYEAGGHPGSGGGWFHPSWVRRAADEPHVVGGEAPRTELLLGDIRRPRREGGRLIHAQHCAGAVFGGPGAVGPREAAR